MWPSYVAGLSLAIIGGVIGDRLAATVMYPLDKVARIANGMEPLPTTFANARDASFSFPEDWWTVIAIAAFSSAVFLTFRVRQGRGSTRAFWLLLVAVFVVRFFLEGHIPWSGWDRDYGVAHYAIYKVGFLIENLLIVGLAWQATRLGWTLMLERTEA